MTWRFHAFEDAHRDLRPALIIRQDGVQASAAVVDFKLAEAPEGMPADPVLSGPAATAFLQAAMDEAYRIGLRPSNADPHDEAAIKRHLEDMRALAFHKIGAEKP